MAARALITQKPATPPPGATASWAAPCSSQSSGTDSPESGRQRRRRGKIKMQQRITDLVAQNRCLRELVDEILRRFVCQDPCPSAEIFDLFGDDVAVATAEAAVQTDISVDWCRPDIFVTLPQSIPAHADAAAGEGMPDCTSISLDSKSHKEHPSTARAHLNTRQALEVDNSKHRVPGSDATAEPFASVDNEQYHASYPCQSTRQKLADDIAEHRVSAPLDFNSQNLAPAARPFVFDCKEQHHGDKEQHHGAHATRSTRQELDVDNAKHRVPGSQEFVSQSLALSAEPIASGDLEQHHVAHARLSTRQELFDTNAKHRVSVSSDFNSQDLALAARPFALGNKVQHHGAHAPQNTRQEHEVANAMHRVDSQTICPPQGSTQMSNLGAARNYTDVKSRCRKEAHRCQISVPQGSTQMSNLGAADFNSQDLALTAVPFASGAKEQCTAQVLEDHHGDKEQLHGAHAPQTARQEHEVANAMHRVADFSAETIVSEDLEQHHVAHARMNTRQELDDTYDRHRVSVSSDFNSQNLALVARPFAFGDKEQHHGAHAPHNTRQEHEVANAMHRVASQPDFTSQDLALTAVPFASGANERCTAQALEDHHGNKEQHHGAHAPQYARQEHEVANAMHRVSSPADFNSQDLARTAVPFASGTTEQCTAQALDEPHSKHRVPGSSDFNSQNLALSARPFAFGTREQGDKEQHHVAHAPQSTRLGDNEQLLATLALLNTRLELEVNNAKHRASSSSDFNSQNLALPAGHRAFGTKEHGDKEQHHVARTHQCSRQELEVAEAMHQVSGSQDFNSQDLARSAEPFAFGGLEQHHVELAHQSTRQELEVPNAKHRVSGSADFNPHNLAPSARPLAFVDKKQHHAAHALQSPRQELEVTTALHRVTSSTDISFGDKEQHHGAHAPQSTRQELEVANAKHRVSRPRPVLPQQFIEVASSIIGVYGKRRKPTRNHIMSAAAALIRVAKKHGVTYDDYKHFVEGQSLALMCAISDHWCTT